MISKRKRLNIRLGFSLVELIVVIVIIGVLATLSYVTYTSVRNNAIKAALKSDLTNVVEQLDIDKSKNGSFPATQNLIDGGDGPKISSDTTLSYSGTTTSYCISATSALDDSIVFHINSNDIKNIKTGICHDKWKMISANDRHTCAISTDDHAYCWGMNNDGQLGDNTQNNSTIPVAVSQGEMPSLLVRQISVGNGHTCAIALDNDRIYCWGYGSASQPTNGTTGRRLTPVAIARGSMPSLSAKQISAGSIQNCAIATDDNQVYCWGAGNYGQLGNGATTASATPVAVSQGLMTTMLVKQISAGYNFACAVGFDDKAYCWGYNNYGQLGNNFTTQSTTPVAVLQGAMTVPTVKQISAGEGHSCVVASNDQAYCWGRNRFGQLGNNSTTQSLTPVAVSQGAMTSISVKYISASVEYTCVIATNDYSYCWGYGNYGQLGNGSTSVSLVPSAVDKNAMTSRTAKQISTGGGVSSHTCVIESDDHIYCWGANSYEGMVDKSPIDASILGTGNITYVLAPTLSSFGAIQSQSIKQFSAGRWHNCIVAGDDHPYCWGGNYYMPLGNGSNGNSSTPVAVAQGAMPSLNVKQISASSSRYPHTCAIASNDQAYCWGENNQGQLGNNSLTDSSVPVAVSQGAMPSLVVKQISAGGGQATHTCAIASNDQAYCWGSNSNGQLGDNTYDDRRVPVAVLKGAMPSLIVKQIATGGYNTCVIAIDDQAYCWGEGDSGEMGNGSESAANPLPVAVSRGDMPSLVVKQITMSDDYGNIGTYPHVCAIAADDHAYCWGYGYDGQLGNGTSVSSPLPSAVSQGDMASLSVKQVVVGVYHSCALGFDNHVYCWGTNDGQLGDGTFNNVNIPVAVKWDNASVAVRQIYGGGFHTCAVLENEKVYCWGHNAFGQLGTSYRSGVNLLPLQLAFPD